MNIKQAKQHLEALARTPAQREALETLYHLACERDNALEQAEREHKQNEKLYRQLDAALALIGEMKA